MLYRRIGAALQRRRATRRTRRPAGTGASVPRLPPATGKPTLH
jgi:hypothetical protein